MHTAPRIVVIDDKKDHLDAIVSTFNSIGTDCYGIHYDAVHGVDPTHLRGVRALFLDLHLLDGAKTASSEKHFNVLSEILQSGINASGGPYVLVLWTTHPEKRDEFEVFLNDRLFAENPHTRPISILGLDKATYINLDSGEVRPESDLIQAVRDATEGNPQLNALLAWERDVMAAAGSTLSTILDLVPAEHRGTAQASIDLDQILSLLAREQVGAANVRSDVRSSITTILAPILADRIMNRDPAEGAQRIWEAAVTQYADEKLTATEAQAAAVNRMLHISSGTSEILQPFDWGAVVDFPETELGDAAFNERFGMTYSELLNNEFKVPDALQEAVTAVLVRLGAACDHAQSNAGPLPYCLGIIRPTKAQLAKGGKLKASVWTSPTLSCVGVAESFNINVNVRFPFVCNTTNAAKLKVRFRLREQLLSQLLNHSAAYSVRPGIVCL